MTNQAMKQIEVKGLKFWVREGHSDEKTIAEVVQKNAYQKKYFKVERGENWLDLGGNIGAFTVLAASLGANVKTFEPDPFNVAMIRKNLALNGLTAQIVQGAVVADDRKSAILNLWTNGQSWRNSIVRNKKGTTPMQVPCFNFFELIKDTTNVKMDIEGSEIEILVNWEGKPNCQKMVFEWSFDADNKTATMLRAIAKLELGFPNLKYSSPVHKVSKWDFFPPCTMVHCWK
jgi:FkbM family methyltransferase